MRHLKRFNEAINVSAPFEENRRRIKAELQDCADQSLAYLLDDDVEVSVTDYTDTGFDSRANWDEYGSDMGGDVKLLIVFNTPKTWGEIKDHMIPFLIRFDRFNYELHTFGSKNKYDVMIHAYEPNGTAWNHREKVKDLINDRTSLEDQMITSIRIFIKGYKAPERSFISKIKSYFK